jgi:outer membrane lipoprotein SlyB
MDMPKLRVVAPLFAAGALLLAVPACGPSNTGSTFASRDLGRAAYVSYGTIVSSRPLQVAGSSGVGTLAGAAAGATAGSFIGGDTRSNILAGLGGAIVGGIAGGAIERSATGGTATEFVVREDRGVDIAVVQTNEEGLQTGDRVAISRSDRVRLSRLGSGAPLPAGVAGPAPGGAPPK